jgi:parvulin-like peptidyl-prolyl isomerase
VLAGDLLTPSALAWLEKVSPGLKPEQIKELKLQICRQVLPQHVESLVIYVDACRTIPEDRLPDIEKKVNEAFDEQQLPRLIKDAGLANSVEYEQLLKSRGQSLDRIRKTFFERALAQQWVQQKVTSDEEIPHADMIAWYQNHLADYDFPAKAKFEQLTARITPTQTRDQAWNKLAAMGNDVLEGKPFAEIARTRSEGPTAATGGAYDWTTKGSLASKVLDEAIFRLPVGQLSTILDDGTALHIVRVTERTEAGRTPFVEAQVGIRQDLMDERRKREMDDYLAKLKDRTPVWTIFDGEPPMATAGGGRGTVAR